MFKLNYILPLGLCVVMVMVPGSLSHSAESEEQVKAAYIEKFTRFIEWPASDPSAPFIIGIYGSAAIYPYLSNITADRTIMDRRVQVRMLGTIDEIYACQVVYAPGVDAGTMMRIIAAALNRPILTIGEAEGFGAMGVLINFYHADEFIRFEINETAVQRSGLVFSSKLLRLARILR